MCCWLLRLRWRVVLRRGRGKGKSACTMAFSYRLMAVWCRTEYLAYLTSVDYVISLFAPSLAAVFMQKNMWLPFWAGFGLIALSFPLIVLLPRARNSETVGKLRPESTSETSPLIPETSVLRDDGELGRSAGESKSTSILWVMRSFFASYFALVANRRNFRILLGAFCLAGLSNSAMGLLHVYISKRYQWPFARVCPLTPLDHFLQLTWTRSDICSH